MQYIEEETIELAAANKVSKGEEIVDIIFEDEPRFSFFLFIHDYKGSEVSSIGISTQLLVSCSFHLLLPVKCFH